MKDIEIIMDKLRKEKAMLREKYGIKNIGVFGSYVRNEQTKKSDVDILVEFDEPVSLLEYMAIEHHLSDVVGKRVDLVMKAALKPIIGAHIKKEVVFV